MPVYISYDGGATTQTFNITSDPPTSGGWLSLGTFAFQAGTNGYVDVTDDADNIVFADAVMWVQISTQTPTPSNTPTDTPTSTDTLVPSNTPTASITPTASNTPTASATSALGSLVDHIVDDQDGGYSQVGAWMTYTGGLFDKYASSVRYKSAGNGSATGTFTPNLPEAGEYEVFAWLDRVSDGASNQPFTINHSGGPTMVTRDLKSVPASGSWVSLGTYTFPAGTAGSVVTSDNANGRVVADAVRWYKPGTPTAVPTATNTSIVPASVILDGGSTSGAWVNYTNSQAGYDFYGGSGLVKLAGSGSATVTFQPNMPKTASYEVFIWVDRNAQGAANMRVDINHAGGTTPVLVDIKNAAFTNGGWLSLGTFTFNAGTGGTVVVTDQASSGYVIADAIRWVEVP